MTNQTSTTSLNYPNLVGWNPEPPGRGTLTLLASCLATTMLCTWIVIHPRIDKRKKHRLLHKLVLWLKTIVAPEFIAVEAAQEWTQARKVIRDSSQFTKNELGMVQAFYIGMFGLRYQTQRGTKILWPNQFVWLLENDLVQWKDHKYWGLASEEIQDKGNSDTTGKVFAASQVAWFVVHSVVRVVHNLPLAPLEVMTLSYVPLFAVAYFYWWTKPRDIEIPSVITLPEMSPDQAAAFSNLALAERFDDEGTNEQNSLGNIWTLTPRLFEKEALDRDCAEVKQTYHRKELLNHASALSSPSTGYARLDSLDSSRNEETVLAHWDPELYHSRWLWPLCCIAGISFPALHLLSWKATFPTLLETWFWRTSTIASMVSMLVFMQFEKITVRWTDPLTILKIFLPILYMVSRVVLLGVTFAAFRAMDPAVYETYNVSVYWFHIT